MSNSIAYEEAESLAAKYAASKTALATEAKNVMANASKTIADTHAAITNGIKSTAADINQVATGLEASGISKKTSAAIAIGSAGFGIGSAAADKYLSRVPSSGGSRNGVMASDLRQPIIPNETNVVSGNNDVIYNYYSQKPQQGLIPDSKGYVSPGLVYPKPATMPTDINQNVAHSKGVQGSIISNPLPSVPSIPTQAISQPVSNPIEDIKQSLSSYAQKSSLGGF